MVERCKKLGLDYDPKKVELPKTGVYNYQDGQVPFLRLKVSSVGNRIWQFEKSFNKKHFKRTIGDALFIGLNEARLRAYEFARKLQDGEMPPTLKQRIGASAIKTTNSISVGGLFEKYYEDHVLRRCRTHKEIWRGFHAYWEPIKNMQVPALTPVLVRGWKNKLAKNHGAGTANKQFTSLRATLRWGVQSDIISLANDPLRGIKLLPLKSRVSYLKPGDELERLTAALESESQEARDIIWLLLWTGQRKTNVLSMRWEELDIKSYVWHIPSNKTKSGRNYSVALTPRALLILNRRHAIKNGSEYVFPGQKKDGHFRAIQWVWSRVRENAGLKHLRLHDLRHTAASWLALHGASAMVIKEALQHSSISTSQRYVHLATSDVREMMAKAQQQMMG
jgi:integrase